MTGFNAKTGSWFPSSFWETRNALALILLALRRGSKEK
jgi:hypothetical protein